MLWFELVLLAFVLIAALLIVWGTLRTGISPMMSSAKARKAMLNSVSHSEVERNDGNMVDLGSGWGTLVFDLARQYPQRQVIGYELSWLPWFVSVLRKRILRLDNVTLYRKDFLEADLSQASTLTCYLFKEVMSALEEKIQQDQLNGLVVVSNSFALPSLKPEQVININDLHHSPIYTYRI